jgi:hypothetical protein
MITIFIPTEFRPPKKWEWIHYNDAYYPVSGDYSTPSQIVEKHTIEVPSGATCLSYHFRNACVQLNTNYGVIELPQKKVKVKKHQYVHLHTDHCGRKRAEVTGWLSEPEALVKFAHEWAQKISGTEIEIEE